MIILQQTRGLLSSGDQLALDLPFAETKSLAARIGPTPTFTRASTATFVGSNGLIQTAAVNAPRFDHDPVTLASRGLLIEESRTNRMPRSQDFSSASWTKSNLTVSGTLYTDPSGTSTANELVENTTSAGHTCSQSAGTATIGTTYTFSVFVKRKDTSNQFLLIGATNLVVATFLSVNLTNGVTATGIGSPAVPINVSSTAYPNGWYRVQFSVVATSAAATTLDIRLSRDGTWANRSYLGDGVQSSLIWGAQVEVGSFPTSYIPTTTSALARSSDVCSITGSDFTGFYNNLAGTIFCEHTLNGVGLVATPNTASIGTDQNSIQMRDYANSLSGVITSDEDLYFNSNMSGSSFGVLRKSSMAFQNEGSAILCLNGTLGNQDNSIILPSDDTGGVTPTELILFGGQFSTVKSFRYFKKRLPNDKLQSLTT